MSNSKSTNAAASAVKENPSPWAKLIEFASVKLMGSIGGQALVSGFHFALNLFLLRLVTPYEYGVFAFAFVIAMFASAVNNALLATPLTVYTPVIKHEHERVEQEAMLGTLNLALFVLILLAGFIYVASVEASTTLGLGVTVFVAAYSARHYSRSVGYARLQPLVTASGDASYVFSGVIIIAAVFFTLDDFSIGHVLMALAAANLFAMLVERLRLNGVKHRRWSFAHVRSYAQYWSQSRWALIGSLTTLFMAQAHSVIITTTNGPNAFAPLAAGFVLFGPVRVALLTWQNMVKPELAIALSESNDQFVKSQIRTTTVITVIAVSIMSLGLWAAWPWIHDFLYSKQYADQPMAFIVAIWCMITVFATSYNAPSAGLQAMREFKVLAMSSIYGALISGVLVSFLLYLYKPEITLIGVLIAEAFMALYLSRVLFQRLKVRSDNVSPDGTIESAGAPSLDAQPINKSAS